MTLQNLSSNETSKPQNFEHVPTTMGERPSMFNNDEFVPRERMYTQQRQEMQ